MNTCVNNISTVLHFTPHVLYYPNNARHASLHNSYESRLWMFLPTHQKCTIEVTGYAWTEGKDKITQTLLRSARWSQLVVLKGAFLVLICMYHHPSMYTFWMIFLSARCISFLPTTDWYSVIILLTRQAVPSVIWITNTRHGHVNGKMSEF